MKTPIVDAHLHIWRMPCHKYPWSPLRGMRPTEPAPVEMLLDTMGRHNVDKAIIVQPSNYGYDHRYVADCLKNHPDRFGGVALVDFASPDAPRQVRELHAVGFRAVRLYLYHEQELSWVGEAIDPVLEQMADLGMVVAIFGAWSDMDRVRVLAQRHQTVPFVIDHLGHPDVAQPETWLPVLRLAELPTVYLKVSDFPHLSKDPYPYNDVFPFVREAYRAFTARRMMWASNFPHIVRQAGYAQALSLVDAAFPDLSADERTWIMGGTAAKLWGLTGYAV